MKRPAEQLKLFKIPFHDKGSDFLLVRCPFHNESENEPIETAKGGVHKVHGTFTCFGCDGTAPLLKFLATKLGMAESTIAIHSDNIMGSQGAGVGIDPERIAIAHRELMDNSEMRAKLINRHGINTDSIVEYQLGFYPHTKRILIPVFDRNGSVVTVRQYKYDPEDGEAKIIAPKHSQSAIYLLDNLERKDTNELIITEGEFKAILLNQNGFNAIATTAGASGFKPVWCSLLKGKDVVILFDVDEAGRRNSHALSLLLLRFASSVKNITLTEVYDIKGGDITDYFVKKLCTKENLRAKIDNWKPMVAMEVEKREDMNDPIAATLANCSDAALHGKIIKTTAVVSAKDTAPYIIPCKGTIRCDRGAKCCVMCPILTATEGPYPVEVPPDASVILELINTNEDAQDKIIIDYAGVPGACKRAKFYREDSYNIEELRLVPQIKIGSTHQEQVTSKAYCVGKDLSCNNAFDFTGRVCSDPKDSHATAIFYEHSSVENDLNNFVPSADLSIFKSKEATKESVTTKLMEIYEDLSQNVTRIYRRPDLHMFYDLIWHTALHFNFQGKEQKGWGDGLVLGDSGQGKSETASMLMAHYKCGERVDTKRASVAGIVGGLQETSNRWFITWGTIPLNDRRLVLLEEIKGMGTAELSKMTDMRSSGMAELNKIERARAYARTRLIWISNPRSDSKLGAYNHGVIAVRELIGALEDIRRFDMVMAVASGDVPIDVINAKRTNPIPHVFTSELCSNLVSYAWSRKSSDICIDDATETAILEASKRMGAKYSSDIPIVEPSDQRLKIARMAVACAIRVFSTDAEGRVLVLPCHVQVVEEFMDRIYSSKSLGYLEFSIRANGEKTIGDKKEVINFIKDQPAAKTLVEFLMDTEYVVANDIMNACEVDMDKANSMLGALARMNCVKKAFKGQYRKTPAFIDILKSMNDIPNLSQHEIVNRGDI